MMLYKGPCDIVEASMFSSAQVSGCKLVDFSPSLASRL